MLRDMQYEQIKWAAFRDELQKQAFVAQLGRGVINAGLAATRMAGAPAAGTGAVRAGMKALGSSANLQKAVGGATLAAGAGAGVGYMAGRPSQPRGYGYY